MRKVNLRYNYNNYIQLAPLQSCNTIFNFLLTVRGTGKTFGMKRRGLLRYFSKLRHPRTLWVRYFKDDIKTMSISFLPASLIMECVARFGLDGEKFKTNRKGVFYDGAEIFRFCPLGEYQRQKGAGGVEEFDTIVFDEFLIDPRSPSRFHGDAFMAFMDIYTSYNRGAGRIKHPVKAFFLGNEESQTNRFFTAFSIPEWITERGDIMITDSAMRWTVQVIKTPPENQRALISQLGDNSAVDYLQGGMKVARSVAIRTPDSWGTFRRRDLSPLVSFYIDGEKTCWTVAPDRTIIVVSGIDPTGIVITDTPAPYWKKAQYVGRGPLVEIENAVRSFLINNMVYYDSARTWERAQGVLRRLRYA